MSEIQELLKKYLRYVRPAGGGNIAGPCPFHKGGQERRPSFYMSTTKGLFFCHACGARGTLAQFLKAMGAGGAEIDLALEDIVFEPRHKIAKRQEKRIQARLNESILGIFDYCPTDLVRAGFRKEFLRRYEVGFDRRNMRIVFPLRDRYGTLVAIIGRTVVGDFPRYKCYCTDDLLQFTNGDEELEATYRDYEVNHRAFLWNMHNVYPSAFFNDLDRVVVVEGYKACLWLVQSGHPYTVAIQGSQSTYYQEELLSRLGSTIYLFLDNNLPGQLGVLKSGGRMVDRWGMRVFVCQYPQDADEDTQPDNLSEEALKGIYDSAISFRRWRMKWIEQNGEHHLHNTSPVTSTEGRARAAG